jgi:auxin efflux carrier
MNEINARLIYLGTDLILPLIVGYLLYQRRLLSDAAVNLLIRINVVVFFTLLSLFSFWALPLTRDLVISDPVIRNALVLFACVPAAINATLTARLYHLNVDYTIAVFLVTTVLYLTVLFPAVFFLFR